MTPPTSGDHASDEILALYALRPDEVDANTVAHIAQCATCQQAAALFGDLGLSLEERLSRLTCPPAETLTAYALKGLPPEERRTFESHLEGCRRCAEELQATRVFLERTAPDLATWTATAPAATAAAPAPGPLETVRRILAQLLPSAPAVNPAFAVMGSTDEGATLQVFRAEDVTITLRQEAERGVAIVTGSLRSDAETPAAPHALLARLLRVEEQAGGEAPKEASSHLVAESAVARDTFEFEGVASGHYQIEVLLPDRLVVIAPVIVGE